MSIKIDVLKMLKTLIRKKQFPILLGIFLCMLVAGLWKALEDQEDDNRFKAVETEAQKIAAIINIDLQSRIHSLERITNRWEIRGGTPKDEFEKDARAYIVDSPGYQAIEWVDRTFHVRWIVPLKGNEAAQNLNLAFENTRLIALENARDRKFPTLTSPIDLIQGGKGFLVYHPIFVQDKFEGFVLAVFRTQEWLAHILQSKTSPKEKRKFLALISMDDKQIYSHEHWDKQKESKWEMTVETNLYGHRFSIRCQPSESFINQSHSILPEMVLGAGVLLSLLSSVIVFLIQKAKNAIQETLASKVALENEIIVRKQAEGSLAKERQRLAYILAGTNVGTWEWNVQTGETIFNERWANIIGYNLEELAPISIDTWTKFVHPDDLKVSSDLLEKHFNGELDYYEFEARLRHKDGNWVWVLDRGRISTKTDDGKPLLMSGTHQDITRQKQIEEKISHLATHDTLTDLPSLRLANDRISMAIESAKRNQSLAATLFVDLDGFKMINDTHGHNAGDAVLREVAKRLLSCVRKTDTVARVGGDEFLLVLTEFQNNDLAASIAKKIINILAQSIPFERVQLTVGASIGIAIYPNDSDSADGLIKQADEAMYVSKKSGKNRYTFANTLKS
ncbi:MAG: diguanylate cyclase [Candidatus Marinimicrobia bacterium]|jgi:diguanylate cyclase (GGDEF)-like protein/PAS domain S-box-containing protein|nr:diguanylate cyclase [Candidatus Neomarinimicrobiota bacterium]MBT3683608.1 diguanylate cyclase [Candidatus Neomarinimicrobiota bacterium]MBT3760387.1 diguanylate cyclase [Candidatus Neomarinimicrobiota bacterium]MBT3896535.1 diguanylate cyclase [Candidatus Neomarinimicrobiota bacterium]MBT4173551.1 diguanylate cyclase [Candidatus Neomarinimicrobiota bacterium]